MIYRREGVPFDEVNAIQSLIHCCNSKPWNGIEAEHAMVTWLTGTQEEGAKTFRIETTILVLSEPAHQGLRDSKNIPLITSADFNAIDFGEQVKD